MQLELKQQDVQRILLGLRKIHLSQANWSPELGSTFWTLLEVWEENDPNADRKRTSAQWPLADLRTYVCPEPPSVSWDKIMKKVNTFPTESPSEAFQANFRRLSPRCDKDFPSPRKLLQTVCSAVLPKTFGSRKCSTPHMAPRGILKGDRTFGKIFKTFCSSSQVPEVPHLDVAGVWRATPMCIRNPRQQQQNRGVPFEEPCWEVFMSEQIVDMTQHTISAQGARRQECPYAFFLTPAGHTLRAEDLLFIAELEAAVPLDWSP